MLSVLKLTAATLSQSMVMFAKSIQALAVSHARILMVMLTLVLEAFMLKISAAMRRQAQEAYEPIPLEERRRLVQVTFMRMV